MVRGPHSTSYTPWWHDMGSLVFQSILRNYLVSSHSVLALGVQQ